MYIPDRYAAALAPFIVGVAAVHPRQTPASIAVSASGGDGSCSACLCDSVTAAFAAVSAIPPTSAVEVVISVEAGTWLMAERQQVGRVAAFGSVQTSVAVVCQDLPGAQAAALSWTSESFTPLPCVLTCPPGAGGPVFVLNSRLEGIQFNGCQAVDPAISLQVDGVGNVALPPEALGGAVGGGMLITKDRDVHFKDCAFTYCGATHTGGAIALISARLHLERVYMLGNAAGVGGGAVMAVAEEVLVSSPFGTIPALQRVRTEVSGAGVLWVNNTASTPLAAGAGGAVLLPPTSVPDTVHTWENFTFAGNQAGTGGAALCDSCGVLQTRGRVDFLGNRANVSHVDDSGAGGGLLVSGTGILRVSESLSFVGNSAVAAGGGMAVVEGGTVQAASGIILLDGNQVLQGVGGGLAALGSTMTISSQLNSTRNRARFLGGSMFLADSVVELLGPVRFSHNEQSASLSDLPPAAFVAASVADPAGWGGGAIAALQSNLTFGKISSFDNGAKQGGFLLCLQCVDVLAESGAYFFQDRATDLGAELALLDTQGTFRMSHFHMVGHNRLFHEASASADPINLVQGGPPCLAFHPSTGLPKPACAESSDFGRGPYQIRYQDALWKSDLFPMTREDWISSGKDLSRGVARMGGAIAVLGGGPKSIISLDGDRIRDSSFPERYTRKVCRSSTSCGHPPLPDDATAEPHPCTSSISGYRVTGPLSTDSGFGGCVAFVQAAHVDLGCLLIQSCHAAAGAVVAALDSKVSSRNGTWGRGFASTSLPTQPGPMGGGTLLVAGPNADVTLKGTSFTGSRAMIGRAFSCFGGAKLRISDSLIFASSWSLFRGAVEIGKYAEPDITSLMKWRYYAGSETASPWFSNLIPDVSVDGIRGGEGSSVYGSAIAAGTGLVGLVWSPTLSDILAGVPDPTCHAVLERVTQEDSYMSEGIGNLIVGNGSSLIMRDCETRGQKAAVGGAVLVRGGHLDIDGLRMFDTEGFDQQLFSGGIHVEMGSNVSVRNVRATAARASGYTTDRLRVTERHPTRRMMYYPSGGGKLVAVGARVFDAPGQFYFNEYQEIVDAPPSKVEVINCSVHGFARAYPGVAVYIEGKAHVRIRNLTVTDSLSDVQGAAVMVGGDPSDFSGAADFPPLQVSIEDSTFRRCSSTRGSGGALAVFHPSARVNLSNTLIDEPTLTGSASGGAIAVADGAFLRIRNLTVLAGQTRGFGGGGLSISGRSTVVAEDVMMVDSAALGSGVGGAISVSGIGSEFRCDRCTFVRSRTGQSHAGTLFVSGAALAVLSNSRLEDSTTQQNGGGILATDTGTVLVLNNVAFNGLTAQRFGGGLVVANGAHADINRLSAVNCSAVSGGGSLYLHSASADVRNSSFVRSTAENSGGALLCSLCSVQLVSSTTYGCSARAGGDFVASGSGAVIMLEHHSSHRALSQDTGGIGLARLGGEVVIKSLRAIQPLSEGTGGGFSADLGGLVSIVGSVDLQQGRALAEGGGVYLVGQGSRLVANPGSSLQIQDSQARSGGGVFVGIGASALFNHSTVTLSRNAASLNGAGLASKSGMTIARSSHVSIQDGTALENGGGVSLSDQASLCFGDAESQLSVVGNKAIDGGGIHVDSKSQVSIASGVCGLGGAAHVTNNSATGRGGALSATLGSSVDVGAGVSFYSNAATGGDAYGSTIFTKDSAFHGTGLSIHGSGGHAGQLVAGTVYCEGVDAAVFLANTTFVQSTGSLSGVARASALSLQKGCVAEALETTFSSGTAHASSGSAVAVGEAAKLVWETSNVSELVSSAPAVLSCAQGAVELRGEHHWAGNWAPPPAVMGATSCSVSALDGAVVRVSGGRVTASVSCQDQLIGNLMSLHSTDFSVQARSTVVLDGEDLQFDPPRCSVQPSPFSSAGSMLLESASSMSVDAGSQVLISAMQFLNATGGGLTMTGASSLHVGRSATFSITNSTGLFGGGMSMSSSRAFVGEGVVAGMGCNLSVLASPQGGAFMPLKLEHNVAERGGGLFATDGSLLCIVGANVSGNRATSVAGGVHLVGAHPSSMLVSSIIASNYAACSNGGLLCESGSPACPLDSQLGGLLWVANLNVESNVAEQTIRQNIGCLPGMTGTGCTVLARPPHSSLLADVCAAGKEALGSASPSELPCADSPGRPQDGPTWYLSEAASSSTCCGAEARPCPVIDAEFEQEIQDLDVLRIADSAAIQAFVPHVTRGTLSVLGAGAGTSRVTTVNGEPQGLRASPLLTVMPGHVLLVENVTLTRHDGREALIACRQGRVTMTNVVLAGSLSEAFPGMVAQDCAVDLTNVTFMGFSGTPLRITGTTAETQPAFLRSVRFSGNLVGVGASAMDIRGLVELHGHGVSFVDNVAEEAASGGAAAAVQCQAVDLLRPVLVGVAWSFVHGALAADGQADVEASGCRLSLRDVDSQNARSASGAHALLSLGSVYSLSSAQLVGCRAGIGEGGIGGCVAMDGGSTFAGVGILMKDAAAGRHGGCIHVREGGNLTLVHSMLVDCQALSNGGGVYVGGSSQPEIEPGPSIRIFNSTLSRCSTTDVSGRGGALYMQDSVEFVLERSTLANCSSASGGCVATQGAIEAAVVDSTLADSSASLHGGCWFSEVITAAGASVSFTGSTLRGCEALEGSGGGLYLLGGASRELSGALLVEAVNSSISRCFALQGSGGGISATQNVALHSDVLVTECAARQGGGVAAMDGSRSSLNRSSIVGNTASFRGGGVFVQDAELHGLGVTLWQNTANIEPLDVSKLPTAGGDALSISLSMGPSHLVQCSGCLLGGSRNTLVATHTSLPVGTGCGVETVACTAASAQLLSTTCGREHLRRSRCTGTAESVVGDTVAHLQALVQLPNCTFVLSPGSPTGSSFTAVQWHGAEPLGLGSSTFCPSSRAQCLSMHALDWKSQRGAIANGWEQLEAEEDAATCSFPALPWTTSLQLLTTCLASSPSASEESAGAYPQLDWVGSGTSRLHSVTMDTDPATNASVSFAPGSSFPAFAVWAVDAYGSIVGYPPLVASMPTTFPLTLRFVGRRSAAQLEASPTLIPEMETEFVAQGVAFSPDSIAGPGGTASPVREELHDVVRQHGVVGPHVDMGVAWNSHVIWLVQGVAVNVLPLSTWTVSGFGTGLPLEQALALPEIEMALCPPGFAQSGTAACAQCFPGFFSPEGLQCLPCPPGSAAPNLGQDACSPCPPGTFQPLSGEDSCRPCSDSRYTMQVGQSQCLSCPAEGVTCVGGTASMQPGFFFVGGVDAEQLQNASVDAAQLSLVRPSMAQARTASLVLDSKVTPFTAETQVYSCLSRLGCKPVNNGTAVVCAEGHVGIACGSCAQGYVLSGVACVQCFPDAMAWALLVVVAVAAVALIIVAAIRGTFSDIAPYKVATRILLNYIQVLTLTGLLRARGTVVFRQWFALIEGMTGMGLASPFAAMRCVLQATAYEEFAAALSFPLMLGLVAVVSGAVAAEVRAPASRRRWAACREWLGEYRFFSTLIFVGFLAYAVVTMAVLNAVRCTDAAIFDHHWLVNDMNIPCFEGSHIAMVVVAVIVGVVFCLGFPVMAAVVLSRGKRRLELDDSYRSQWGFLIAGLKPDFAWYESAIMARKMVMSLVVLVLNPVYQVVAALLVLFIALNVHLFLKPYKRNIFNLLDALSLWAVVVSLMLSLSFLESEEADQVKQLDPAYTSEYETLTTVALLAVNLSAVIAQLYLIVRLALSKKHKPRQRRDPKPPPSLGGKVSVLTHNTNASKRSKAGSEGSMKRVGKTMRRVSLAEDRGLQLWAGMAASQSSRPGGAGKDSRVSGWT